MLVTYTPIRYEYRQIHKCGDIVHTYQGRPSIFDLKMFYFHNRTGIALLLDYWGGKVRYFKFALCEHEMKCTNVGRCLNRYDCTKCDYSETLDSSD